MNQSKLFSPLLATKWVAFSLLITPMSLFSTTVQAASDAECGIWLCAPMGFAPPGCGEAFSAMKSRIFRLKSPLPSFYSCMTSSPNIPNNPNSDHFTSDYGIAAKIASHNKCNVWSKVRRGSGDWEDVCDEWEYIPEHYIKGVRCQKDKDSYTHIPRHCTGTYRYIETYKNGVLNGDTFYYK
ncbi:conserved exported hypothetical protein [Vibrio nigripulchritudo FTn2]|uniref:hypothetical protein n=1 Tax=Vibrio nigripulchritudo TaxID=28173 RepID=UPI0003B1FFF3|nr:hypothetical protein [Vibrio nigripulchritudo]CCN39740.1 conserved exported hypothetical protein [Vibrio nigripulchritudo FTn2]